MCVQLLFFCIYTIFCVCINHKVCAALCVDCRMCTLSIQSIFCVCATFSPRRSQMRYVTLHCHGSSPLFPIIVHTIVLSESSDQIIQQWFNRDKSFSVTSHNRVLFNDNKNSQILGKYTSQHMLNMKRYRIAKHHNWMKSHHNSYIALNWLTINIESGGKTQHKANHINRHMIASQFTSWKESHHNSHLR